MKGLSVSALTLPVMILIQCFPSRKREVLFFFFFLTSAQSKELTAVLSSVWCKEAALIPEFAPQSLQTSLSSLARCLSLSACEFYTCALTFLFRPFCSSSWHKSYLFMSWRSSKTVIFTDNCEDRKLGSNKSADHACWHVLWIVSFRFSICCETSHSSSTFILYVSLHPRYFTERTKTNMFRLKTASKCECVASGTMKYSPWKQVWVIESWLWALPRCQNTAQQLVIQKNNTILEM